MVEMPVRGSMIESKRGIKNQRDGVPCDLMCKLMAMLIGGIDVPGGTMAKARSPYHLKPDADGVVEPKGEARDNPMHYPPQHINLSDYFPHKHTLPVMAYKVCQDPKKYGFDYTIEASLTVDSNPAASTTEPYEVVKGILNIPFAVNIAYHYDEMAQLSDILLASNSVLERESVNCFEGAFDISTIETNNQRLMMYRDPLPPIYNTRQPQDIIIELCDRMGMIDEFNANLNKVGVVGVVRVDAEKCIGCQMCMNACPYDARSFFSDPNPTYWEEDGKGPDEYEKMRYKEHKYNTPDKCDFCVDRRAQGLPPACVATCAGKARIFGDMDDPNSEISKVIKKYHPKPLNPELKTKPHVLYIVDEKNCPVELMEGHKARAKEVQPTGLRR